MRTFPSDHLPLDLTSSRSQLNVEQVFEAAVPPHAAAVRHRAGAEQQAALPVAARVVGDHGEDVEIAALPHVRPHLDGDVQALVLLLLEQLVLVVGLLENLALFVGAWEMRA